MERVSLDELRFDERGLIPVVVQDVENGDVLMVAWANRESLERTIAEGRMVYWSRSRGELWRKGDTSGDRQWLRAAYYDCDGDTLLFVVEQEG
ncbi:MAG TPA: phosphoribosyl-AMP cyclohydrolase, partial [Actinomycetota bacterium]